MSEDELGASLLRGEHPVDVQALTLRVLRRDRRHVRWLAAACIVAWMLVVMLPWSTMLPMLARIAQHMQMMNDAPPQGEVQRAQHEEVLLMLRAIKVGTIATFIGSVITMFGAAICTVSFIVVSRRATLRQVNARLGEISDQLRLLANKPQP